MKEIIQEREGLRLELVKTHQLVEQYKASSTAAIKVTEAEKDSKMPTFIEEKPAVKTRDTTAHMQKQSETSPPAKDNYEEEDVSFASSQRNRWYTTCPLRRTRPARRRCGSCSSSGRT